MPTTTLAIGLAALALAAALVVGAIAISDRGGTDEPGPDVETAAFVAPEGDACGLSVESVTFALDPVVARTFVTQGLGFATIWPAKTITTGQRIAPRLHAERDVTCDLSEGYIGMRGGFRVAGARGSVEFRRFRLKIDEREMFTFLRSTGNAGLEAVDLLVDEAQFTHEGSRLSAVVPMVLDHGASVAMNATLGTDFPADEIELGTVTISGTRVDARSG